MRFGVYNRRKLLQEGEFKLRPTGPCHIVETEEFDDQHYEPPLHKSDIRASIREALVEHLESQFSVPISIVFEDEHG